MENCNIVSLDLHRYQQVRQRLCALYQAAYQSMSRYAYQDTNQVQAYLDWLYQGDPSGFFIAERAADVLGFVAIHVRSCVAGERPAAELHEVVVDPRWQRRGIGKALFSHTKEYAQKRGCKAIALWVGEKNRRAIALYRRIGFRIKGRWRFWIRMELTIVS